MRIRTCVFLQEAILLFNYLDVYSEDLGPNQTKISGWYPLVMSNIAIENDPFIVVLPINNGDFPVRYVKLPEGK